MLRSGFVLYIAPIGEEAFRDAESYEQELIAQWDPVRAQKTKACKKEVETIKPWKIEARSSVSDGTDRADCDDYK